MIRGPQHDQNLLRLDLLPEEQQRLEEVQRTQAHRRRAKETRGEVSLAELGIPTTFMVPINERQWFES